MPHIPVQKQELVHALNLTEHSIVADCTANGGGHATEIVKHLGAEGVYIGIDLDADALCRTRERLNKTSCIVHLMQENYRNIDSVLTQLRIPAIHAACFDLGMSSDHLERSGRGFSFQNDEPLLMTFKREEDLAPKDITAKEILNTWDEEHIADILRGYGEERFAKRIARAIVETRKEKPFQTTRDLVRVIEKSVPKRYIGRKTHLATKTFQALRITVNDEIESLREGISKVHDALSKHGRIAVISFHSIEDRVVKHFFIKKERAGTGAILTKKPIVPSKEEIARNPRARSAKLRIFEKRK